MDENETDAVNAFEVFKDAIKAENLEVQIRVTKQLGTLAKHLGEELTRNELIPFIQENIDFHDEILLNLSEQLNQFIPLVGGYEHSQSVLDLLRKLCNTDETIVRDKTVETMKTIAKELDGELTEKLLLPIVDDLAIEDWFTSKCSAAALIPAIYPKVREEKKVDLRHSFRLLIQDESPIVRKEAARNLVDLISVLDKNCLKNEFIAVFDNISKDPMDSVRSMLMRIAIALCKNLTESEIEEHVFETVVSCAEGKLEIPNNSSKTSAENKSEIDNSSWRSRQMLAHHIGEVQENIPFGKMRGKILAMYQKLINDMQDEVRIEAVNNLSSYCLNMKKSYETSNTTNNFEAVFEQSIVPHLKSLVVDPNENVRLSFASNIPTLSMLVGENCFKKNIMPTIEYILEQESSMQIQETILQGLYILPTYVDLTESLLSIRIVVRHLIVDSQANWRTRRSLLVAFMHIAKTATSEYFLENLKMFYATLLGDPVFAVRRTAPVILPLLAKQYGIAWVTKNIIPFFKMFTKDCRYLYRFIPLFGLNELINPSIRLGKKEMYLNDLRHILLKSRDDAVRKKVAELLTRIKKMANILKYKLEEDIFKDILSLNESIDDFKNDNIVLYAGECKTTLEANCNCDIFTIEDGALLDQRIYLDGLLALIIMEYLKIILHLFDDPIVNVQIRSIHTLNNVKEFTYKIDDELKDTWVSEAIIILSEEEREQIEELMDYELNQRTTDVEEIKIDTELMKDDVSSENIRDSPMDNVECDRVIPEIKVETVDDLVSIVDESVIANDMKEKESSEVIDKPLIEITEARADEIWTAALNE